MAHLHSLQIHRYRSTVPTGRLEFNRHHNVLLGLNGSGKSTFLDLLWRLPADDLRELVLEPLDIEYEIQSATSNARFHVRLSSPTDTGTPPRPALPTKLGQLAMEAGATADVTYVDGDFRHRMTWDGEWLRQEQGESKILQSGPFDGTLLSSCLAGAGERLEADSGLARRAFNFFLEIFGTRMGEIRRFAEDASPFYRIVESRVGEGFSLRFDLRQEEDGTVKPAQTLPYGSLCPPTIYQAVIERAVGAPQPPDSCYVDLVKAGVLSMEALEALGFAEAHARITLTAVRPKSGSKRAEYDKCDFVLRRSNGDVVSSVGLSFGQRRFLALHFLAAVDLTGPLFIDEMANGLHYRLLDETLVRLDGRQTFMTSQNPLLLDTLLVDTPEDLQRMFLVTGQDSLLSDESTMFHIRQLDHAEAVSIFEAKQAGFRTLSSILRSLALW